MLDDDGNPDDLLYQGQVAREFGIPSGTLRSWRADDKGPPSFCLGEKGSRVVYRRSELLAWLEAVERKTRRGDGVDTADDSTNKRDVAVGRRVPHRPRVPHRDAAAGDEPD